MTPLNLLKGQRNDSSSDSKEKIDGTTKVILSLDLVQLEETFVKSSLVEINEKTYAVIDLPKFYISFDDENFRDSAKDMEKKLNY